MVYRKSASIFVKKPAKLICVKYGKFLKEKNPRVMYHSVHRSPIPLVHSSMDRCRGQVFSLADTGAMSALGGRIYCPLLTTMALSASTEVIPWVCAHVYIWGRGWGSVAVYSRGGHVETLWRHQNRLFSAYVVLFSRPYRADCNKRAVGIDAAGERVKSLVNSNKFIPQWKVY